MHKGFGQPFLSVLASRLMGMEPVADDLERQAVADAIVESTTPPWSRSSAVSWCWRRSGPTCIPESLGSGAVLPGTERSKRYGGDGHAVRG